MPVKTNFPSISLLAKIAKFVVWFLSWFCRFFDGEFSTSLFSEYPLKKVFWLLPFLRLMAFIQKSNCTNSPPVCSSTLKVLNQILKGMAFTKGSIDSINAFASLSSIFSIMLISGNNTLVWRTKNVVRIFRLFECVYKTLPFYVCVQKRLKFKLPVGSAGQKK